jgi:hypothetical protein
LRKPYRILKGLNSHIQTYLKQFGVEGRNQEVRSTQFTKVEQVHLATAKAKGRLYDTGPVRWFHQKRSSKGRPSRRRFGQSLVPRNVTQWGLHSPAFPFSASSLSDFQILVFDASVLSSSQLSDFQLHDYSPQSPTRSPPSRRRTMYISNAIVYYYFLGSLMNSFMDQLKFRSHLGPFLSCPPEWLIYRTDKQLGYHSDDLVYT